MEHTNLILTVDSYKLSHPYQYEKGCLYMHDYIESRGGRFDSTVFFGLQGMIKEYLTKSITKEDIDFAEHFCSIHGEPFYKDGWEHILNNLGGFIPIRINAVPEGSIIPNHNVLMTIESTDPKVFWIVGHLETLLMQIWYPITVATQSYYTRQIILESLRKTADNPEEEIEFKHHSFGYRGVSSCESAGIGGAAELLSSKGTDTIAGILYAMKNYNSGICGASVCASEHGTITSWSKEHEIDAYRNMIKQFGKNGIFACVSDSYDIFNAISNIWGGVLKDEVIKSGATVVIRLDSGDPIETVSKSLHLMEEKFGTTINSKGYKVLNNVRALQGDGINIDSIKKILDRINGEGFSTSNIVFGQGGGSLQKVDRDTYKFACKCSAVMVDNKMRGVYKSPVNEEFKKSKAGQLDLVYRNGEYITTNTKQGDSCMRTVFENGRLLIDESFDEIRNRLHLEKI